MSAEGPIIRSVLLVSGVVFWIIALAVPAGAIVLGLDYSFNDGSPGLGGILWGEVAKFVVPSAILGTLCIALAIREFRRSKDRSKFQL